MNNPRPKPRWKLPLTASLAGVLLGGAAYLITPAIARRQAVRFLPPLPAMKPPPPRPLAPTALYAGTQDVPVLMYHDVTDTPSVYFDVTTADFRRQMTVLKRAGASV